MAMSHHKTPPPIAMEVKYSEDWWGIISSWTPIEVIWSCLPSQLWTGSISIAY
jgi:hypothetical protein